MLDPRGPDAARIVELWWVMFVLAGAVSVGVIALLVHAVRRSRGHQPGQQPREIDARALVWGGGVVLPLVVLFPLLLYSYRVGAEVYPPADRGQGLLTVEVIGHQFWWEVRYPEHDVSTANEIYIPAGERVRFLVSAPDVIHSFWVPQLHGKIDMIPGRLHFLQVQADEPGLFRGQCAEYCGMGHALMAFWVVALPAEEFTAWLERRGAPAAAPGTPDVARGREVFAAAGCGHCHATPGAPLPPTLGTPAPDLGDFGARRTIAAGTLPNTPANLARWISEPDRVKPGVRMPATNLAAQDLQAIVAYLGSLR